ncbi:MAG: hypothetical protein IMW89_13370 [Ktedonobacteraceae bacterium]|nr:hypothetical protein [Ktedonobacteraceae bacterium]
MQLCGYDWPTAGTKQIAYIDREGHVQELSLGRDGMWKTMDLTDIVNAPRASQAETIVGFAWPAGRTKQVVYMDRNRHIQELYRGMEGNWQCADLTMICGAPLVDGAMLTAFPWEAGKTKQVAFIDSDYHIQEMCVAPGGYWQVTDLTAITGAPLADGAALVGYEWPAAGTKHIAYIDNNGHVQELSVGIGGQWQVADITAMTNAPLAYRGDLGVPLAGCSWAAGGTKQLVYRDRHGHIQELFVSMGARWQCTDLTMLTGTPPANSLGGLSAYEWPAAGTKQVVYLDSTYHLRELFVGVGGSWQSVDLTAITSAPRLQQGPVIGFAWTAGNTKQVIYTGPRESVQELYVAPGGQWQVADLTLLTSSLTLV